MARIPIQKTYLYKREDPFQKKFIFDVINANHLDLKSFAKSIHVTDRTLAKWISGEHTMRFCHIAAIVYMWIPDGNAEDVYKKIKEENENGQKER